jgi:DNA repair protein RecO (recombination protein O)
MRVQDQPAFVLHRRQYSESSLLIETYTCDHGRIGMIARGARGSRSALPALLQPFQELKLGFVGTGDLQRLTHAEALGSALQLRSERALAGLYCNELMVRLLPRGDAFPALYGHYRNTLCSLVDAASVAWVLRCFERDLLAELGYAADFERDAAGAVLEPDSRYRFEPEAGFVEVALTTPGYSGAALLTMLTLDVPDATHLRELRRLFRELIGGLLRGEPLRSWSLMSGLSR